MGKDVTLVGFDREDRQRYRRKVRRSLDVFALMLNDLQFETDHPSTGMELELDLVNGEIEPAMRNAEILANMADPAFQTELGQFNLELNLAPRMISGYGLELYERDIATSLAQLAERAGKVDASVIMVGILPTLEQRHATFANLSTNRRYHVLNEQMLAARGEDMLVDLRGAEHLRLRSDSIAPESACTSVQFHLQLGPDEFAAHWNAAQAVAGVQVALGANSPYLFGRQLWAETRIPLFLQATDVRTEEMAAQGVRPRVWFGERWISSALDLFEENVRYFAPLLHHCEEEDPAATFQAGGVPRLAELRLHNGTVYRWNRPVYDVANGRAHLRVENRPLPAGPTIVDIAANAALYYGLVAELAAQERPIWTQLPFGRAEENLNVAARHGMRAELYWPGPGQIGADRLVREYLLALAYAGLDRFGVAPAVRDRLLGVIEARCRTGRNGATWQVDTVRFLEERFGLDRRAALRAMVRLYLTHQAGNDPVHTWPVG